MDPTALVTNYLNGVTSIYKDVEWEQKVGGRFYSKSPLQIGTAKAITTAINLDLSKFLEDKSIKISFYEKEERWRSKEAKVIVQGVHIAAILQKNPQIMLAAEKKEAPQKEKRTQSESQIQNKLTEQRRVEQFTTLPRKNLSQSSMLRPHPTRYALTEPNKNLEHQEPPVLKYNPQNLGSNGTEDLVLTPPTSPLAKSIKLQKRAEIYMTLVKIED